MTFDLPVENVAAQTCAPIRSVRVAVATFRRPQGLATLLESLGAQDWDGDVEVVVVDNDPDRSARDVAEQFRSGLKLTYVSEPEPGIAAARNAALRAAETHDAVAFIDDDEAAPSEWLRQMVEILDATGAAGCAGPVIGALPERAPWWVRRLRPHDSARQPTGTEVLWPATNNALVRTPVLQELGTLPFDQEFGLTGGSDADLFWRLKKKGHVFVWSDESVVTEFIPASRLTFAWWWRRSIKQGNVSCRMMVRHRPRRVVLAIGVLRVIYGVVVGVPALLSAGRLGQFANLPKGIGTIRALRGNLYIEYART